MIPAIIIPAFNPDHRLPGYIRQLRHQGDYRIIVVDDGSVLRSKPIFESIRDIDGCIVLVHKRNMGKGAALKTAFRHVLGNCREVSHIVTADADGQHAVEDVVSVVKETGKSACGLVFGVRDFIHPEIPARSLFGNRLTSHLFRILFGRRLHDTQTGLRGIPRKELKWLMTIRGDRYDYEMNTLIHAVRENVDIREVGIRTIYLDRNASSHYRPLVDSARIFLKIISGYFSGSSLYVNPSERQIAEEV
ncbi:glycosyltransferase family 2 protein [Bhargavaea beijingensis]|uniref:Glycosyl transferase family 2 n=1 Tax=Bhargavaea beijingensis TaxID=426756 RepID=A0A1G7GGU3_9BACL|nr:glycosyltransferase family 2 protein [Bhargavaea beijingensis]RSK29729.1 glycosyltransferase family 2 protein [Bhargavaea beijingensis]SDE87382.1 Glycosyl transferase family 2 [Bhargavaea beijingensis]